MRGPFTRRGDGIRWTLQTWEPQLLRDLRDDLHRLVTQADGDDPAVARLFPVASRGDDEADAELRRLIHDDLLAGRLAGLDALVEVLDRAEDRRGAPRVDLTEDEPALVLGVLNDVRLALGARIGVENVDREDVDEDHPLAPTLALMDHLAYLQESLLGALDPTALAHYDDLVHEHDRSSEDEDERDR